MSTPPPDRPSQPGDQRRFKIYVTAEEAELVAAYRDAKNCAAKTAFDSETVALREAIRRMARSGPLKSPKLRVYRCAVCGKFHLTKRFHNRRTRGLPDE